MKSVLISIQPKWVEKICHEIGKDENSKPIYEKRIEVRKTAPKEVPFKAYIYCSYGNDRENYMLGRRGKVVGEFICDKVDMSLVGYRKNEPCYWDILDGSCLTKDEIMDYGKWKIIYGWHISDLKIYDKPKELSEFRKSGFMTEEEWLFNLYPNTHCHYDAWAKKFEITRPPQSWCYVEEL